MSGGNKTTFPVSSSNSIAGISQTETSLVVHLLNYEIDQTQMILLFRAKLTMSVSSNRDYYNFRNQGHRTTDMIIGMVFSGRVSSIPAFFCL